MSVSESPLDGARSPLCNRETSIRVSLRPPGSSGIISIHQRSKVRSKDFLVLSVTLLRFVKKYPNHRLTIFYAILRAAGKQLEWGNTFGYCSLRSVQSCSPSLNGVKANFQFPYPLTYGSHGWSGERCWFFIQLVR